MPQQPSIRVRGNSMNRAGLQDGMLLPVKLGPTANHGDIVLAWLDGQGYVVKRLVWKRGAYGFSGAWLVPDSTEREWKPRPLWNGDCILGVVVRPALPLPTLAHLPLVPASRIPQPPPRVPMAAESPGAYRVDSLPALADFLLVAQASVPGISGLEFARSIGITEAELGDVQAGWVPENKVLTMMAARLGQLTGIRLGDEQVQAFARSPAAE